VNSSNWSEIDIRIYAVLASLLLSLFTILIPDTPNADAFDYIRTAEIVLEEGLEAAFAHYSWASYPVMIAATINLFGTDPLISALIINTLFYAVIVFSFLSIVKEIDDAKSLLVIATITILTYPQLNEFRYLIIRDIGFWAFSLFGLWQFILLGKSKELKYALGFCMAYLFAATLRAEALAYLIVIPISLLFDTRHSNEQRLRLFFQVIGIIFIAGLLLSLALFLIEINVFALMVEFISVYAPFISNLTEPDEAKSLALSQALFNEYAATYSSAYLTSFITAGLFAIIIASLINSVGGPFIFVLLFGFFKKTYKLPKPAAAPIIAFCLTNALIVFVFIFITRYLASRYLMPFSLMVAFMIPLIIHRALEHTANPTKALFTKIIIVIFFLYCAVDSYYSFGITKSYVNDTVTWIEENTSASSVLITNNHSIAYYSGRVEDYDKTVRKVTESQIREASVGTYIILEMYYEVGQLVESDNIASLLEIRANFPEGTQPRLTIYQRINPL
jgi:hypothetical protein